MSELIAIASDHAGVELKDALKAYAQELGFAVEDLGTQGTQSVDYPDYADKMAAWIFCDKAGRPSEHSALPHASGSMSRSGGNRKGILICGSGIGISIAANRHKGIRAALCRSGLEARLSREHNDANVLCIGARISGIESARDMMKEFFTTAFAGGRHAKRVEKMG